MKTKQNRLTIQHICMLAVGLFVFSFALLQLSTTAHAFRVERTYQGSDVIATTSPDSLNVYDTAYNDQEERVAVGDLEGGTFDIDPTAAVYNITAPDGCWDFFIAKYNPDNSVEWAYSYENTGCASEMVPTKPFIDANGNIYFVGLYTGTFDFDPTGAVETHTSTDYYGVYVSKFSDDGTYQWTQTFGDQINSAEFTTNIIGNNFVVTSSTWGTSDLDPSAATVNTTGDFMAVYSLADGSYQYHKDFSVTTIWKNATTSDAIYLVGDFTGTVDIDPGAGVANITSPGSNSAFVVKLNASGDYQWSKVFGGSDAYDTGFLIEVAPDGSVYAGGSARSSDFDLDPSSGTQTFVGNGTRAVFLVKLTSGGDYIWGTAFGDDEDVLGSKLHLDGYGNAYIRGRHTPPTDFDPTSGTDIKTDSGVTNTFLWRINKNNRYVDTLTWHSQGGFGYGWMFDIVGTNTLKFTANLMCYSTAVTVDLNPLVGDDTVSATSDGCDVAFFDVLQTDYYQITAPAGKTVKTLEDVDASTSGDGLAAGSVKVIRISEDTKIYADVVTVDFVDDLDWTPLTMDSDPTAYKSYIHGVVDIMPGATFTLYVPYSDTHNSVGICPGATSLEETNESCDSVYFVDETDDNVEVVTIDGNTYWAVSGLIGTGGFGSVLSATDELLADTGIDSKLVLSSSIMLGLLGLAGVFTKMKGYIFKT